MVTAVDPVKHEITVRVGDPTGSIPRKQMEWAGKLELVSAWGKPGPRSNARRPPRKRRKAKPNGSSCRASCLACGANLVTSTRRQARLFL